MKSKKLALSFLKSYWALILVFIFKNVFDQYVKIYTIGVISKASDSLIERNITAVKGDLNALIIAVCVAIFIIPIIDYFDKKAWVYLGVQFDTSMYNRFLRQKRKITDEYEKGELIYRIENDPLDYRGYLHSAIGEFIIFAYVIGQSLYLMAAIHLWFAVICLVLSVLPGLMPFLIKEWIKKLFKKDREALGEIANHEKKMVDNFIYTRVNSLSEKVLKTFDDVYERYFKNVFRKKASFERGTSCFNNFFSVVCQIVIYIIGSILISKDAITIGQAVEFFGLSFILKDSTEYLVYGLKACYQLGAASDRLLELVGDEEIKGVEKPAKIDSIDIKDLSFSYGDKEILKEINLSVKKGEHVIFKGENGSGKTTIIKLLIGLYDNYSGDIEFNGTQLNRIDLKYLREHITLVSQVPFLFNTTVYENVAMARKGAKSGEVEDVIRRLGLYDIKDKEAGENGAYLSGGQRQRISIARALLRDTPVVILDEPDNALDIEVSEWIKKIFKDTNKTIIVITHNNSWMEISDKVYSLS